MSLHKLLALTSILDNDATTLADNLDESCPMSDTPDLLLYFLVYTGFIRTWGVSFLQQWIRLHGSVRAEREITSCRNSNIRSLPINHPLVR